MRGPQVCTMGRLAAPDSELNDTIIFSDKHTKLPVTNRKNLRRVLESALPMNCLRYTRTRSSLALVPIASSIILRTVTAEAHWAWYSDYKCSTSNLFQKGLSMPLWNFGVHTDKCCTRPTEKFI